MLKLKHNQKITQKYCLKKHYLKQIITQKETKYKEFKKKFQKKYLTLINKNKKCQKYGYKFNKILIIDIQKRIPTQTIQVNTMDTLTNNKKSNMAKHLLKQ